MVRKIGILVFILVLAGGGFFYWQNNQKDVQELNKNLPNGVKVVKSLFGQDYKVINKIDGYEFKVPSAWRGIEKIIHTAERTERGHTGTSIELEGKEGAGRIVSVDRFDVNKSEFNLEIWVSSFLNTVGLTSELDKDKLDEFEIIKTKERIGIVGYIYFFEKDAIVYAVTGGSEEFIREIITNGKW
jgi:hypothetical protein